MPEKLSEPACGVETSEDGPQTAPKGWSRRRTHGRVAEAGGAVGGLGFCADFTRLITGFSDFLTLFQLLSPALVVVPEDPNQDRWEIIKTVVEDKVREVV